jgi:hypothetical protein
MRALRFGTVLGAGVWLGLAAAPGPVTLTVVETFVHTEQVAPDDPSDTPYADSLVDWEEHERQSACLWDFLQAHNIELTLQNILTAGDWTDMHGGACAMMGDGDDGLEG